MFFAMIPVLLLLAPVLTKPVSTLDDTANSLQAFVSASPTRIQEGNNTMITIKIRQAMFNENYTLGINVTDPAGTSVTENATIVTNATGFGEKTIEYWREFEGASTDYVGTYKVAVENMTANETLAATSFNVGLTYQLKHRRNQTVLIKGSGYKPSEKVTINIKLNEISVTGYPKNLNASNEGITNDTWQIPGNATAGVYTVTMANATTSGTAKTPADSQDFYVEVWTCQIQALNLANEPVGNLVVRTSNKTVVPEKFLNLSQQTNETGWASLMLATGNYTFRAFWKQVEVGIFPTNLTDAFSVENDTVFRQEGWVQLSNLRITIIDEASNETLPFIHLRLEYNYTTEANENLTESSSFETNFTGTVYIHNLFVNHSYVVQARRYGVQGLSLPTIQNRTSPLPWNNITIGFPVYTASIHVEDSKNNTIEDVRVEVYEWSSGLAQNKTIGSDGKADFSLTFGRYKVRLYKGTILLYETAVDLTQNQSSFDLHLSVYNIDFTVAVVDYFKQPVPNAMVKIERNTGIRYEETATPSFTGPDGQVMFNSILGGDSQISVYIGGQLTKTKNLYLTGSKHVTFDLNRFVVVAGSAMEVSQLMTLIGLVVLLVTFIVALTYKKLSKTFTKSKQAPTIKKSL